MSESARSMILGPSVLYGVAAIAMLLTIIRRPARNSADAIDAIIRLYWSASPSSASISPRNT